MDGDRAPRLRLGQRRVGRRGDAVEARVVSSERQQHAAEHHRLAADPVAEPAEEDVERRADQGDGEDEHVLGRLGHAQGAGEEDLDVEEGQIPDRPLRAHDAEEGDQHALQIVPFGEALAQRRLGHLALGLELGEGGALAELEAHPHRDDQQQHRDQERNPPAPRQEPVLAQGGAGGEDHQQPGDQADRGGDLDPAGHLAALVVGRMLGDVDRRPAIFAAERDALADAQQDEQDRRDDTGARIGRQHADQEGGAAHQADGGEERALAPQPVADHPEDERAQRPEGEAGGEQAERGDQPGGRVEPGEEHLLDGGGEAAEDEKVVPFERGASRGGGDDALHRCRFVLVFSCAGHATSPRSSKG